jgi:CYTH domain-containing protein
MRDAFKYTRFERERRFLVSPAAARSLGAEFTRFEDLYVAGTRSRLRIATHSDGSGTEYKLTQKLQQPAATHRRITTIYLSEAEHRVFAALPGRRLVKQRHRWLEHCVEFGIDVFEGAFAGLVLAEIEADSDEALRAISPPTLAAFEVTEDVAFTGGALAAADPAAMLAYVREQLASVQPKKRD